MISITKSKMVTKSKKGGIFFTLDAVMAGIVLLMTSLVILSFFSSGPVSSDARVQLDLFGSYIHNTYMEDVDPTIYNLPEDSPYEDLRVHEMIAHLNQESKEENLSTLLTGLDELLLLKSYGVSYKIDNDLIYERRRQPDVDPITNISTSFLTFNEITAAKSFINFGTKNTTITIWN